MKPEKPCTEFPGSARKKTISEKKALIKKTRNFRANSFAKQEFSFRHAQCVGFVSALTSFSFSSPLFVPVHCLSSPCWLFPFFLGRELKLKTLFSRSHGRTRASGNPPPNLKNGQLRHFPTPYLNFAAASPFILGRRKTHSYFTLGCPTVPQKRPIIH